MQPRSVSFAQLRPCRDVVTPCEARRRFELWAHEYDQRYGSENSPLTYTLRAQLPIELDPALDLVVVEIDVMQDEFFGASGWQRALFLDDDGAASDLQTCDLQLDPEGWTVHRYGNGDLLRITAAGIVSNASGQVMLAPVLKRFDKRGAKLWTSKRIAGALANHARDEELFDLERPLPLAPERIGIAARGDHVMIETDRELAVIDATCGKRLASPVPSHSLQLREAC